MAQIEVVYVPESGDIWHSTHALQAGMTVHDVLVQSGVFEACPEARDYPVGIFSKPVTKAHGLKPGDRVEIYRALLVSPKEKRRMRAKKA